MRSDTRRYANTAPDNYRFWHAGRVVLRGIIRHAVRIIVTGQLRNDRFSGAELKDCGASKRPA